LSQEYKASSRMNQKIGEYYLQGYSTEIMQSLKTLTIKISVVRASILVLTNTMRFWSKTDYNLIYEDHLNFKFGGHKDWFFKLLVFYNCCQTLTMKRTNVFESLFELTSDSHLMLLYKVLHLNMWNVWVKLKYKYKIPFFGKTSICLMTVRLMYFCLWGFA